MLKGSGLEREPQIRFCPLSKSAVLVEARLCGLVLFFFVNFLIDVMRQCGAFSVHLSDLNV